MSKNNPHFSPTPFIRGVNIGAWLVLEKWITPSVFEGTDAVDQWTFDATPGARDKLTTHWSTFFDQTELRRIADTGINALRIPIGYWAYDNTGTPYLSGADAYLERAVHWARESHLKVWIDLHGAPGSQNGNNHSGRAGSMDWQEDDNLQKTIDALIKIATKYGTSAYGDVIIGIELINEPSSWGKNNFTKTKSWTIQAYRAVRAATQNTKLQLIMHDSFQPAANWSDVLSQLFGQRGKFAMDTHPYQLYTDADNALNQDEHVSKACAWSTSLFKPYHDARIPVYAGEWSANSNVCVNPDGSTLNGTSSSQICKVAGCQCVADTDPDNWSVHTKTQVRRYVDAQLQTFEKWSNGYFFWNWKGPGGWNFLNGVAQGWIPSPISSFAKVC
ncbi:glycoside hydrolase [Tothia fuscella]|uniref:glucan 1,3-beta-glucosidase n=1 Tax=Tothia fuscella TaxID=1048955 RepID=A0A9P4NDM3_9PEZI|nr:glycoside hydrolase [Tothia fuscella]